MEPTIHDVELVPDPSYGKGHWKAPEDRGECRRYQLAGYYGQSSFGYVDATGSCRRVYGGPVVPGPYLYGFGLAACIMADSYGDMKRRHVEAVRNAVILKDGDLLRVPDGNLFRVVRISREHFRCELVCSGGDQ